jgi:hypothetical protein
MLLLVIINYMTEPETFKILEKWFIEYTDKNTIPYLKLPSGYNLLIKISIGMIVFYSTARHQDW